MLEDNVGYNVSAEQVFERFDTIGKTGTFVTDRQAIADAIGDFSPGAYNDPDMAQNLEQALGLDPGSLEEGFRITKIEGIRDMSPRSPIEVDNPLFLGGGGGLPGGGPEIIVDPVPTR